MANPQNNPADQKKTVAIQADLLAQADQALETTLIADQVKKTALAEQFKKMPKPEEQPQKKSLPSVPPSLLSAMPFMPETTASGKKSEEKETVPPKGAQDQEEDQEEETAPEQTDRRVTEKEMPKRVDERGRRIMAGKLLDKELQKMAQAQKNIEQEKQSAKRGRWKKWLPWIISGGAAGGGLTLGLTDLLV